MSLRPFVKGRDTDGADFCKFTRFDEVTAIFTEEQWGGEVGEQRDKLIVPRLTTCQPLISQVAIWGWDYVNEEFPHHS